MNMLIVEGKEGCIELLQSCHTRSGMWPKDIGIIC